MTETQGRPWRPHGLRGFISSFRCAGRGIYLVARREPNFQFHLFAACVVVVAGAMRNLSRDRWIAVVVAIILVLMAESLNSAIEKAMDIACPEYDERVRTVKDMAAAAVLITAIGAAVIAALVFLP